LVPIGVDANAAIVANKIGTYLKALAARDNGVPFWVALPSTTIDWTVSDGHRGNPDRTAQRGAEVTEITGRTADGTIYDGCASRPRTAMPPIPLLT